ncbi:Hint domain-containing protein [Ascidiaceihabitans sp.]|uniref:Hint domain-containing protein n=1 Tax=Ascidiaceihabitans sp. TaxID=1872644 RepID=UPI00329700AB
MFGWKNKANGMPQRMVEKTGAYDGGIYNATTHGLLSGTRVASNLGWRSVDATEIGDSVLTFDHGMQQVTDIRRSTLWVDATAVPIHMWPVFVPAGALGNRVDMTVLPEQGILIESEAAVDQHGDPFAVVPINALAGVRGIKSQPPVQRLEVITLFFASEQVIYTEGALLCHCPRAHLSLTDMVAGLEQPYDVLSGTDASFLSECIVVEDHFAAHEFGIAC